MNSPELEIILISSLNQFAFCQRRFALLFVEGIWEENEHTILGTLLHEQADEPGYETENNVRILRALPLFSKIRGLSGKADVVEIHDEKPFPIEYKKGKRRAFDNDDVQVCAQAFCLEEMFQTNIAEGAVYHASSKKRRIVSLTETLRKETESLISQARGLLEKREIPRAEWFPKCEECSLLPHCMPHLTDVRFQKKQESFYRKLWNPEEELR